MDGQLFSFDLNELPIDEENIVELEENGLGLNVCPKGIVDVVPIPEDATLVECGQIKSDSGRNEFDHFIGQCFLSEEEAFVFYRSYASRHGFSIRKDRTVTKNGELKKRDFLQWMAIFVHLDGA